MTRNETLALALESTLFDLPTELLNHDITFVTPASAFYYLVAYYHKHQEDEIVKQRVIEHIRHFTIGGNEPAFNIGHTWSYPMIVNGITLLKATPAWEELGEDTVARIDCLMKGFAYLLHYACDKDNNYETGLRRNMHWAKGWSPNCYANLLLYAPNICYYFGGREAFAKIFIEFDYDAYVADLKRFNFRHALKTFTTPAIETEYFRIPSAKEILEGTATEQFHVGQDGDNVNYSYGGSGQGIKREFMYSQVDPQPADSYEVFHCGIYRMYKLPCKSAILFSKGLAEIIDGSTSPEEGKIGMFYELNQNWRSGRSSINHARIDFAIAICTLYTMKELGLMKAIDCSTMPILLERVRVGNEDLIYKLEHGYRPYIDGPRMETYETNYAGYFFWKDLWRNELQK